MLKGGRRFHKEDRRYRRGRGPELVVVLDGEGRKRGGQNGAADVAEGRRE